MAGFNFGSMLSQENNIKQIPLDMLLPYENHMFQLYDGDRLNDMVESIKENGVLIPIIVRPKGSKYEILSGHNRANGSKLAGKDSIPAVIKENLTDEEAEMYVIETNVLQRGFQDLRISEQAAVVALRHNQMFSQGKRSDIIRELQRLENPNAPDTSSPVGKKSETSMSKVGEEYGLSKNSVARLIRINKLCDSLKKMTDGKTISVRTGVNLSYIPVDIQEAIIRHINVYGCDMKKSQVLREYSDSGELTKKLAIDIVKGALQPKKAKPKAVRIKPDVYERYFSEDTEQSEIEDTIEKALEMYFERDND
jgi:ParB family chromosome partitioning protein